MYVEVSVAPQSTVNPVPAVTVFIAGDVVIVPPAVFMEIITSEVANSFVLLMVMVPPFVQTKVPLRADATVRAPETASVNGPLDPAVFAIVSVSAPFVPVAQVGVNAMVLVAEAAPVQ